MVDLSTTYLGVSLKNPLVVAASSISSYVDRVKLAEEAGAGALVIRSLFEEQIEYDRQALAEFLASGADGYAESTSYYPQLKHGGPKEHLMWVEKTRKAVQMPLFASLNAVTPGAWVDYARQLAGTGVDGLEINYYIVPTDPDMSGSVIENRLYDIIERIRAEVSLPLAVKLSPFLTAPANVVRELEKRGVKGVVLFNRFLQPDIDPDSESLHSEMVLSTPAELKLPLRWVAILYGRTGVDLALNTGAHTGRDVVKGLLAGARVVQLAATLLKNGIPYLSTMLIHLQSWMEEKGYETLDDFRGNLSQKNVPDPDAFERAQYVKLLLAQS